MNARELAAAVKQAYATASAYTDAGTLVCAHVSLSFKTSFERARERLSFEFRHRGSGVPCSMALEAVGDDATLSGEPDLPSAGSGQRPSIAIASLTGISFGAAHAIPRLLLPERVDGREMLLDHEVLARGGSSNIDGVAIMFSVGGRAAMSRSSTSSRGPCSSAGSSAMRPLPRRSTSLPPG